METMDYLWQDFRDPLVTDVNLAEIDFEDFRNEDLAHAFSFGDEESGTSSTDMSICRSEVLFASMMRESATAGTTVTAAATGPTTTFGVVAPKSQGPEGGLGGYSDQQLQDSLINLSFCEQLKVNKNNYTLTFSSYDSTARDPAMPKVEAGLLLVEDAEEEEKFSSEFNGEKMTTWSKLGGGGRTKEFQLRRRRHASVSGSDDCENQQREKEAANSSCSPSSSSLTSSASTPSMSTSKKVDEEDSNGNIGRISGSRSGRLQPPQPLPRHHRNNKNCSDRRNLVSEFIRTRRCGGGDGGGDEDGLQLREKDTTNTFLKNVMKMSKHPCPKNEASTAAEASIRVRGGSRDWDDDDDGAAASVASKSDKNNGLLSTSTSFLTRQQYQVPALLHPDLDPFLDKDVSLWDAIFTPKRFYRPVVVKREASSRFCAKDGDINVVPTTPCGGGGGTVRDVDSLRLLLPKEHHHLLPPAADPEDDDASKNPKKRWAVSRRDPAFRERPIKNMPKSHSQHNIGPGAEEKLVVVSGGPADNNSVATANSVSNAGSGSTVAAAAPLQSSEYPFQHSSNFVNFDLTYKRGLFVQLHSSVEHMLSVWNRKGGQGQGQQGSPEVRLVFMNEFCPAMHSIMADGLKGEVITAFGPMQTNVWRVVEALAQQGPSTESTTCDLVMYLNVRFTSLDNQKKLAGFLSGLLSMSYLHIWFSKLKWSMDVLLRFYERHAFICAIHKETRLLFDELVFCLQRLFCLQIDHDYAFDSIDNDDDVVLAASTSPGLASTSSTTSSVAVATAAVAAAAAAAAAAATAAYFQGQNSSDPAGICSKGSRTSAGAVVDDSSSRSMEAVRKREGKSRSRIPRPISLPKRLHPALNLRRLPSEGLRHHHQGEEFSPAAAAAEDRPVVLGAFGGNRRSRVRETIKLFDARSGNDLTKPSTLSSRPRRH